MIEQIEKAEMSLANLVSFPEESGDCLVFTELLLVSSIIVCFRNSPCVDGNDDASVDGNEKTIVNESTMLIVSEDNLIGVIGCQSNCQA